jgi:hypothetical protein
MSRPRRLYSTAEGKFYYLIDGKKKFVKVPAGKEKQMASINIKNIVTVPEPKRLKRRKKRVVPKFAKKVISTMGLISSGTTPAPSLPIYFFNPKKEIKTIEDIVNNSDDTDTKKLTKLLLKNLTPKPSSSKLPPSVAIESGTKGFTFTPQEFTNLSERERKIAIAEGKIVSSPDGTPAGVSPEPSAMPSGRLLRPSAFRPTGAESKEDERISESKEEKPTYSKPTRQQYQDFLKKGDSDLMPSLRNTRAERGIPSSFSAASTKDSAGGIAKSDAELAREEARAFVTGGGDGSGLYNDEIEKIAKKRIKDYVPVIAADEINELPRYVARGDKRFGFVINTASSDSDGSGQNGNSLGHWTSVYINNEDDYKTIEFFDPLAGNKMPAELVTICRKIAIKMNPTMMFKYKQNMLRRQSKMTSNCGHHAIKFLDDRFNGIPWSVATGYDDYMEKHSSAPDDSHDGEKDIAKAMKRYESYI